MTAWERWDDDMKQYFTYCYNRLIRQDGKASPREVTDLMNNPSDPQTIADGILVPPNQTYKLGDVIKAINNTPRAERERNRDDRKASQQGNLKRPSVDEGKKKSKKAKKGEIDKGEQKEPEPEAGPSGEPNPGDEGGEEGG